MVVVVVVVTVVTRGVWVVTRRHSESKQIVGKLYGLVLIEEILHWLYREVVCPYYFRGVFVHVEPDF